MATVLGLNIKFAANTAGISKGAQRTAHQLKGIQKSAASATSALRGLVAIEVGKILAGGFAAAANSIGGFIGNIRESVGELNKLAFISNTSVSNFQALATAASMVGVEQDKLADIFKDVNDRVGDFLSTGGGPMADFFEQIGPKVGVTADMFRGLSGPDALQLFIDSLERAGLSQAEMTFYLEAMSSDLTSLLPLLQNGGAGFDELAERAERLGIVLSEDQTSAITEMNNALKLVYQTFEGIIGQVTANLAPVVTSLSEEFLSFVESFQGFGGEGGTGIADALTQGLLDFADYIAAIFDAVIANFLSFGETMTMVGEIFEFVANAFTAVAETLRVIFNVFEMVGNAIMLGLGKVLEGLGSWVSDDLEQTGREMAASASAQLQKNAEEAGDAAANAFNAALGDQNFGKEPDEQKGMFGMAVDAARQRFARGPGGDGVGPDGMAAGALSAQQDLAFKEAKKLAEEQARLEEERLKKIADLNEQYGEKAEEIERNRLDALGRANQKALEASDIRSGGIGQVLALATGREDPAIAEARRQLDELQNITREIRKLGGTVELVGAA